MDACENGHLDVVRELCRPVWGVNRSAENESGLSAFDFATDLILEALLEP